MINQLFGVALDLSQARATVRGHHAAYIGGSGQSVPHGASGTLDLGKDGVFFGCEQAEIAMPYADITSVRAARQSLFPRSRYSLVIHCRGESMALSVGKSTALRAEALIAARITSPA